MIELGTLGPGVRATAESDGWWLKTNLPGIDLAVRAGWPREALQAPGGVSAALQVEALIDLELAEAVSGAVVLRWERFGELFVSDAPTLPLRWTEFSPLRLVIDSVSEIGRSDFRYAYDFTLGNRAVSVDREGYFIRRRATGDVFHLDRQTFAIVNAMDEFNALSGDQKKEKGWITFAAVRGRCDETGVAIDAHLASNTVITPAKLTASSRLDDASGSLFVPTSEDLPADFPDAFLRNSDVPSVYSLDRPDGKRVRVVFTQQQRDVLRRMKETATLQGRERERAKIDPSICFDGLLDAPCANNERDNLPVEISEGRGGCDEWN